jgi:cysteine-rich repeat protein
MAFSARCAAIGLLALALPACGARTDLPYGEPPPDLCGNGKLDPGEQCDEGAGNADRPAVLLTQGLLRRWVRPIERPKDVVAFYGYASASAHTGFEALEASELYLYRDVTTSVISLVTEHGIDIDTTGQDQPSSHVIQHFTGVPAGVTVTVTDDNAMELFADSPASFTGSWSFHQNTDGGALSGFPLPGSWSVDVEPSFLQGVLTWRYVDAADGGGVTMVPLLLDETATLTAFETPSTCRPDCTKPRCGDGILDGGEACDDGNTVDGDGCSADCKALQ